MCPPRNAQREAAARTQARYEFGMHMLVWLGRDPEPLDQIGQEEPRFDK